MRIVPPLAFHLSARPRAGWGLVWAVCTAIAILVWLGFRATLDSRRSTRLLLERRKAEQLALLMAGLDLDMQGAQTRVLMSVTLSNLVLDPPYELADICARGFARFPYPESFFAWRHTEADDGVAFVFNRSNRQPAWFPSERMAGPYPVDVIRDPPAMRPLVLEAQRHARDGRQVAVFAMQAGGAPYQVVVHRFFQEEERPGADGRRLLALFGFTVNLDWVRRSYFQELTRQISRIGGGPSDVSLAILDDKGALVTMSEPERSDMPATDRVFPLVFADRSLLRSVTPPKVRYWTARARPAIDSRLVATAGGTNVTFGLISLAALTAVVTLLVTARSVRVASELADMKSEFVSSVTHELKAPLAVIQLIAETLVRGRYDSPQRVQHYARLLSQESQKFRRLVDNLLTYARLSDLHGAYTFAPAHVSDLVHDALEDFQPLLIERQFAVEVAVPEDLPQVKADRVALIQALDNLIDNAVKYSGATRVLEIRARADNGQVAISVADRGPGIPQEEIARVCDKFFRGRDAKGSGSGLGLAIVRQVVAAHGGRVLIHSAAGQGTRVDVTLPALSAP